MSNKNEIRSAMQEMMNDVMNRGYDLLIQKPEQSEELDRVLTQASESLCTQLKELEQVKFSASEMELDAHYELLSQRAQERNLELLSKLQRISRGQSASA
jgi:hypothetical protein